MMDGANRPPSSLNQSTTTMSWVAVSSPSRTFASTCSAAWRAASTP